MLEEFIPTSRLLLFILVAPSDLSIIRNPSLPDWDEIDLYLDWLKRPRDPIAKVQIIKRVNRIELHRSA